MNNRSVSILSIAHCSGIYSELLSRNGLNVAYAALLTEIRYDHVIRMRSALNLSQ